MRFLIDIASDVAVRRVALAAYGVMLATATHWPQLRFEGPVPRSDLWIHLGAFGTLGALVAMAGLFGPVGGSRNLGLSWVAAVLYAAVDELTQGIPGLGRTVAWDDYGANVLGVTLGVGGVGLGGLVLGTRALGRPVGRVGSSGSALGASVDGALGESPVSGPGASRDQ